MHDSATTTNPSDVLALPWYYKIEVAPGEFTPGRPIGTLPNVRKLIDSIEFKGQRVLDIGTQEFVAPILIGQKEPAEIVAYDRLSLTDQFDYLSSIYDLSATTYVHGMSMHRLKEQLIARDIDTAFDVVFFTGVLYHMVDPLPGLAMARSMVRNNGLLVLETSVSTDDGFTAACNHHASLYGGSNYFQLSPKILDYWCRMLRLEVLDVFWTGGEDIKRMFMVMRAKDRVVAEAEDRWIRKGFTVDDFEPFGLDYSELASDAPPVNYHPIGKLGKLRYTDTKPRFVDVHGTLSSRRQAKPDLDKAIVRLADGGR